MDFGRVGHIKDTPDGSTDAVFMVIGPPSDEYIRIGAPDYRWVINLSGTGYVGGDRVDPGEIAPVRIDLDEIEWLDDPQP